MSSYAYEDCIYILSSFVVIKVDRESDSVEGGDTQGVMMVHWIGDLSHMSFGNNIL